MIGQYRMGQNRIELHRTVQDSKGYNRIDQDKTGQVRTGQDWIR